MKVKGTKNQVINITTLCGFSSSKFSSKIFAEVVLQSFIMAKQLSNTLTNINGTNIPTIDANHVGIVLDL